MESDQTHAPASVNIFRLVPISISRFVSKIPLPEGGAPGLLCSSQTGNCIVYYSNAEKLPANALYSAEINLDLGDINVFKAFSICRGAGLEGNRFLKKIAVDCPEPIALNSNKR